MSAQRPHKIALIGATGYERQAPQRIDCLRWERLPGECNLRDYDTIILNLRSRAVPGGVDWHAFQRVLSFAVAREILESNGRIIILGDPRFSVCTSAKRDTGDATHSVPFLSWTGLVFDWDDQSGDTIAVRDLYRYDLYQEYLRSLKTWRYSLKDCEVDPATWQTVYDLATLRKEGIGLVLKKEILCANRYGNSLAFILSLALEQESSDRYDPHPRLLGAFGPMIFLPETDVDEDQMIVTVLRDLCGVESEAPEPPWVLSMTAPGQDATDNEISQISDRIDSLKQHLLLAHKRRDELRMCLQLLYERGPILEEAVRRVLRCLGADVEDPTERGKEDGWVTVRIAGRTCDGVLEIKSTKNDQFGEEGIRQLLDWVNRGVRLRHKRYKGIFVGNSALERPLPERPWPFSDSWCKSAEVGEMVSLRSEDLYSIFVRNADGNLDRDKFWKTVFNTNGVFDLAGFCEAD